MGSAQRSNPENLPFMTGVILGPHVQMLVFIHFQPDAGDLGLVWEIQYLLPETFCNPTSLSGAIWKHSRPAAKQKTEPPTASYPAQTANGAGLNGMVALAGAPLVLALASQWGLEPLRRDWNRADLGQDSLRLS